MGNISQSVAWNSFLKSGTNSSHFVWFLTPLNYFQSSGGAVFAFHVENETAIFALEPLLWESGTLKGDLEEVLGAISVKRFVFIGIESEFKQALDSFGYSTLKVGEEPWVDLNRGIAKGNSGKKARSARNLAVREGVTVSHFHGKESELRTLLGTTLDDLYREWQRAHTMHLGGFLNACSPYFACEERHYFIAHYKEKIVGVLVASPIPARKGVFLEDLVQIAHAPNGAGELMVFTALEKMKELGVECASLGVVAMKGLGEFHRIPAGFRIFVKSLCPMLEHVANYTGIGVFRDHFSPSRWAPIYIAFGQREGRVSTWSAIQCLSRIFSLFRKHLPNAASSGETHAASQPPQTAVSHL